MDLDEPLFFAALSWLCNIRKATLLFCSKQLLQEEYSDCNVFSILKEINAFRRIMIFYYYFHSSPITVYFRCSHFISLSFVAVSLQSLSSVQFIIVWRDILDCTTGGNRRCNEFGTFCSTSSAHGLIDCSPSCDRFIQLCPR